MKCLQTLSVSFNKIESMKPLGYLSDLKELYLRSNQITKIESLSNFPNLEDLDIGEN